MGVHRASQSQARGTEILTVLLRSTRLGGPIETQERLEQSPSANNKKTLKYIKDRKTAQESMRHLMVNGKNRAETQARYQKFFLSSLLLQILGFRIQNIF